MVNKSPSRHVIGAHYGLRDWLLQRITAVIMLVYSIALIVFLGVAVKGDYIVWQDLMATSWARIFSTITIGALLLHAWVGVRDIWMDYVKPTGLRLTMHVLSILWLLGSFIYAIKVLWGL